MIHTSDNLTNAIRATVCYYDVLQYPLTSTEIQQYLVVPEGKDAFPVTAATRADVLAGLDALVAEGLLRVEQGFYTLPGRGALVTRRQKAARIARGKLRRLRRIVWVLRCVPFVRGVFVTGRLAMKSPDRGSDLDVLIVLAGGHIWMGRFLVTLVTTLLGVRRVDHRHADHICLNYFVTDASLTVPTQDLFAAHEYSWIFPLFGAEAFTAFQQANQHWISGFLPRLRLPTVPHGQCLSDSVTAKLLRKVGEALLGFAAFEKAMSRWQKQKIAANPKSGYEGALIIATDEHLVFLPKPHGPKVEGAYQQKVAALVTQA